VLIDLERGLLEPVFPCRTSYVPDVLCQEMSGDWGAPRRAGLRVEGLGDRVANALRYRAGTARPVPTARSACPRAGWTLLTETDRFANWLSPNGSDAALRLADRMEEQGIPTSGPFHGLTARQPPIWAARA
jgi:hypothetical protein